MALWNDFVRFVGYASDLVASVKGGAGGGVGSLLGVVDGFGVVDSGVLGAERGGCEGSSVG